MRKNGVDIEKLKTWLKSEDPYQRDIALNVFWHMGVNDRAVDRQVVQLLRTDDQIQIRRVAIRFLVERASSHFKQVFIEALSDEDWLVKGEAIIGLKKICRQWQFLPEVVAFRERETHAYSRWCLEEK